MTTRDRALLAACDLAVEEGSQAITLDRVAARAGISKGGLLHHFRSKESLMRGMLERKLGEWEECVEAIASTGFSYPVAYVEATFSQKSDDDAKENALGAVFVAAVASDPALAEYLRERFDRFHARLVAAGVDPVRARLIQRTVDGLFVAEALGAARPTPEEADGLRADLLSLLRPREDVLLAALFRHALAESEKEDGPGR